MADTAGGAPEASEESHHSPHKESVLGPGAGLHGRGVRRHRHQPALRHARGAAPHPRGGRPGELAVLGVVSLVIWALILIVTVKYVVFLMRADNKGEGGTLALMALAQRALGRRSAAGLLPGHGRRGAVLRRRHHHAGHLGAVGASRACATRRASATGSATTCCRSSAAILVGCSWSRRRAPHRWPRFFGPIMRRLVPGPGGRWASIHIADDLVDLPGASAALRGRLPAGQRLPGLRHPGQRLPGGDRGRGALRRHGPLREEADPRGLAVPGPARAWLLNYLGQGALVLHHPAARGTTRSGEMVPAGRLLAGPAAGHRWPRSSPARR